MNQAPTAVNESRQKPLRLNGLETARGAAHHRNGGAFCAARTGEEQAPNEGVGA